MRKLMLVFLTLLVSISLIFTACGSEPATPTQEPTPQETPAPVPEPTPEPEPEPEPEPAPVPEPEPEPAPPEPELVPTTASIYYDDGKPENFASQGPGWGYSVLFSPPDTPFTIDKVKLLASLFGTDYADDKALLEIWDENFDVLYSRELPSTEFSHEGGWIIVEPGIKITSDFRVVFYTNSDESGGIFIGFDSSSENKRSEVVRSGGLLVDWPAPMEETKPEATTNWIIRVTGTYAAPESVSEPEPATELEPAIEPEPVEVELKHDVRKGEDCLSSYGGGYIIDFTPPVTPFTITKVRMVGILGGSGWEDKQFTVAIWDKDYAAIYVETYPVTLFPVGRPDWVEVEIPSIEVTDKFYVHVYTGTNQNEGIHISADSSVTNEHSDLTVETEDGIFKIRKTWPWNSSVWFGDKSKVNWRIRVIGTYMAPAN